MSPEGFEPAIPAGKRSQMHALDRAAILVMQECNHRLTRTERGINGVNWRGNFTCAGWTVWWSVSRMLGYVRCRHAVLEQSKLPIFAYRYHTPPKQNRFEKYVTKISLRCIVPDDACCCWSHGFLRARQTSSLSHRKSVYLRHPALVHSCYNDSAIPWQFSEAAVAILPGHEQGSGQYNYAVHL
jgi:hypothetical protein